MTKQKQRLTVARLRQAAVTFAAEESIHVEPSLYGVTDGKAVGTHVVHKLIGLIASSRLATGREHPPQPQRLCRYSLTCEQAYCDANRLADFFDAADVRHRHQVTAFASGNLPRLCGLPLVIG